VKYDTKIGTQNVREGRKRNNGVGKERLKIYIYITLRYSVEKYICYSYCYTINVKVSKNGCKEFVALEGVREEETYQQEKHRV
jgi:hypothetical protein